MKLNRLNIIVFTGFVAIVGVLAMQLVTLSRAYTFEKKETADKIHFALQDVVTKIYNDNHSELPAESPIKKVAEDYYVVNVNDVFEQDVLEYYLKNELQKVKLDMDYEYAIYDCGSNSMVYGEYIAQNGSPKPDGPKCVNCFSTRPGLIYYFAVRFPDMVHAYISSLQLYWIYTGILVLVLVIYTYSVILLLRQKKYTELQKDFINNMTHEFKTPLSSILIASNYAAKQEAIEANPKLSKYLGIIIEQSNKLNHHIERILSVAKTEEGIVSLHKTQFNLNDTLQLLKENVQLKFENATVSIQDSNEGYNIVADEFHFYNIAYNIVENAVKYGGASPQINITVVPDKNGLVLQFTDNGPGIPLEHLDFIFDRFYRVPRENKKEVEGFGLGLFYVKKICSLHGWKISVKNNEPQGLSISITIPKHSLA
ncbi:histidine kinase [Flavobacterium akiainvivens]|uniref:histidine kinase n=1 Tax=Flavobacterium akiainvivens TaxID=1202724 RepID=A0A0M9VIC4_9FLAO|nr:HAMP domain-containing sensor histidine kinase [Flavobacterium akiainvivens]KOS06469.1 histidine kinase [Flavobacterium akiainvivens]SFQ12846.1 two-component system, OmpR family, phosphate regulon sensor histidine kinase PhoR [Flavobacterium akiainvivens]